MDNKLKEMVQDYDKTIKAGQEYINYHWVMLKQETKDILVNFGCYDNRGYRLKKCEQSDEIKDLEFQIGILFLCAIYTLPSRDDVGISISKEAYSVDILYACHKLLLNPQWQEPSFLRLALNSIRTYQMANLLLVLPPIKEEKFFTVKFFAILVLDTLGFLTTYSSPFFLGVAFVSAAKRDLGSAVLALYVLGFAIWHYFFTKNYIQKTSTVGTKSQDEKSYDAWYRLRPWNMGPTTLSWGGFPWGIGIWDTTGAGSMFYFQEMARVGVDIPPLAIELCAALEASILKKHVAA